MNTSILLLLSIIILSILFFILITPKNEKFDLDTSWELSKKYFNKKLPLCNFSQKSIKKGKIFISIASYRDRELIRTVGNILKTARNPQNLTLCVYEQNDPKDPSIKDLPEVSSFPINLVFLHTHYNNALGPTWARYVIQQQWDGEEYYLQIDSHTLFVDGWDVLLIKMLDGLPPKSVLTQYPPEYDLESGRYNTGVLRSGLYVEGFRDDHFSRIQSEYHRGGAPGEPFVSEAWGGCFSFSRYGVLCDAPYDPYLPYVFFGEELDITLRLYTHGWNFYSPHVSLVFTLFKRNHRRTIWSDHDTDKRKQIEHISRYRLYHRFGMDYFIPDEFDITRVLRDQDKYSMGTERTIQDYEKFAGVDLKKQVVVGHNRKRIMNIKRPKQLYMNGITIFDYIFTKG